MQVVPRMDIDSGVATPVKRYATPLADCQKLLKGLEKLVCDAATCNAHTVSGLLSTYGDFPLLVPGSFAHAHPFANSMVSVMSAGLLAGCCLRL